MPHSHREDPPDMVFLTGVAPSELCRRLAIRVRKARTELHLSQEDFASACGISLSTYKRFESSGQTTLENFVRILTATGRVPALSALFPPPPPNLPTLERARQQAQARALLLALRGRQPQHNAKG